MARLLLVDDDAAGLEIRRLVMERHGHEVAIATNAADARALFHTQQSQCVVLDLRLPELEDGLALIREFRAQAPNVGLIVLAGWSADLDGREESTLVDRVLAKPVSLQILVDEIALLVRSRGS